MNKSWRLAVTGQVKKRGDSRGNLLLLIRGTRLLNGRDILSVLQGDCC